MTGDNSKFAYVDTAIGGEDHRNHPMDIDSFHPKAGLVGVYTTWLRYDQGLVEWWKSHRNANGRCTVSGYRGPALASFVPWDVDRDTLPAALADARCIVQWLMNGWDISAAALRVVFSGSKGFHIELPSTLFGGFAPGVDIPAQIGRLAGQLLEGLAVSIDTSIYEPLRLWRVPNSRHQKTGCYAIPLNVDELLSLDLESIVALSGTPRSVSYPPDDEWTPRPDLVALGRQVLRATSPIIAPTKRAVPFTERIQAGSSRRHNALLSMAGTLRRRGLAARTIGKMLSTFNDDIAADVAQYAVDEVPLDRLLWAILEIDESVCDGSSHSSETVVTSGQRPFPKSRYPVTHTIRVEVGA